MPSNTLCLFLGSSEPTNSTILTQVQRVATDLASDGWNLVYGASDYGLMGEAARIFLEKGRTVTGIIPTALLKACKEKGILNGIDLVEVADMLERKQRMMSMSDAFLTLPGGIGTLDELTEVWSHRDLGGFCPSLPHIHRKPVVMSVDDEASALLFAYFQARAAQGLISERTMSNLYAHPWKDCRHYLRSYLQTPLAA